MSTESKMQSGDAYESEITQEASNPTITTQVIELEGIRQLHFSKDRYAEEDRLAGDKFFEPLISYYFSATSEKQTG